MGTPLTAVVEEAVPKRVDLDLKQEHAVCLVLDYGSQYTQLIARRVRENGVLSLLLPGDVPLERIEALRPCAVILSGGPESVHLPGSPQLPAGLLAYCRGARVPVLGICYGMQLLVQALGGRVRAAVGGGGEYGHAGITTQPDSRLYGGADDGSSSSNAAAVSSNGGEQHSAAAQQQPQHAGAGENGDVVQPLQPQEEKPPPQGGHVQGTSQTGQQQQRRQSVWMSHGDSVEALPAAFRAVATSEQGGLIVAIESEEQNIYGLQYHPEVQHTPGGAATLRRFLFEVAALPRDWRMENVLDEELAKIHALVGPEEHVICALSGGVDSAVAATLVHKALGERLHCVFVDNGLLRYKEAERVMATFLEHLHLPVTLVDDAERMLGLLRGVTDPEAKRKAIGAEFIRVFQEFAEGLKAKHGRLPRFLVQGTLYPDVIESCPPPGKGQKHSHTIKSHHNVGGLPKDLRFTLIEPLRELFKDEVRALGRLPSMNVPEAFVSRHPFPGPGLAVRVLGDVTAGNALETLRQVDEVFIQCIRDHGLYDKIWQAFAVFLPIRSVGVQGDQRTHSHVVALRAVSSADGMTADWYPFEPAFLRAASSRICNAVRGVNRVVYDVTSKPPGTIEWE